MVLKKPIFDQKESQNSIFQKPKKIILDNLEVQLESKFEVNWMKMGRKLRILQDLSGAGDNFGRQNLKSPPFEQKSHLDLLNHRVSNLSIILSPKFWKWDKN